MSRIMVGFIMGALVLGLAGRVSAQVKVIPGDKYSATARVEAIEQLSRTIVLRTSDGYLRTVTAPAATPIEQIHVGDTVNATYYENIVIRVKEPGEPDVDTLEGGVTRLGTAPGGTAAAQQTITATITAIDLKAPSISLSGPRGWSYSSKVQDKKALEQVKVGDKVDITWTEAVLMSVTPATKK